MGSNTFKKGNKNGSKRNSKHKKKDKKSSPIQTRSPSKLEFEEKLTSSPEINTKEIDKEVNDSHKLDNERADNKTLTNDDNNDSKIIVQPIINNVEQANREEIERNNTKDKPVKEENKKHKRTDSLDKGFIEAPKKDDSLPNNQIKAIKQVDVKDNQPKGVISKPLTEVTSNVGDKTPLLNNNSNKTYNTDNVANSVNKSTTNNLNEDVSVPITNNVNRDPELGTIENLPPSRNYLKWTVIIGSLILVNLVIVYLLFRPTINSSGEKLLKSIDRKAMQKDLYNLYKVENDRQTLEYIINAGKSNKVDMHIQPFDSPSWKLSNNPQVSIHNDKNSLQFKHEADYQVVPYSGNAKVKNKKIKVARYASACNLFDFDLQNKVILVPFNPNLCDHLYTPSYTAQEAGALAVLFYLDEDEHQFPNLNPYQPHLLSKDWNSNFKPLKIPVLLITSTMAKYLQLYNDELSIFIDSKYQLQDSYNVIFTKDSNNTNANTVALGTNWDLFNTNNINPYGAIVQQLEVLRRIQDYDNQINIKIIFFGRQNTLGLGIKNNLEKMDYYYHLVDINNNPLEVLNADLLPSNIKKVSIYLRKLLIKGAYALGLYNLKDSLSLKHDKCLPLLSMVDRNIPIQVITSQEGTKEDEGLMESILKITRLSLTQILLIK